MFTKREAVSVSRQHTQLLVPGLFRADKDLLVSLLGSSPCCCLLSAAHKQSAAEQSTDEKQQRKHTNSFAKACSEVWEEQDAKEDLFTCSLTSSFLILTNWFPYRSALNKIQGHIPEIMNYLRKKRWLYLTLSFPAALNEKQPHKEAGKEPATSHLRLHWHYYHDPVASRELQGYRQGSSVTESCSGTNDVQHSNSWVQDRQKFPYTLYTRRQEKNTIS